MAKLKNILKEVFEDDKVKVNPREVTESVRQYSSVGKQLYGGMNMIEVAKKLAEIASDAHNHILGESDDWFDKVTINRNMKSLNTMVNEFKKTATEYHTLSERLTSLYEDMGGVLNRYYDINEDKGDMDNDGIDEPDEKEYLDNKDAAIKKAMKKENKGLKDVGGVISTPSIGYYKRTK